MKDQTGLRPSLENLLESEDLGLELLHPGGLDITRELAGMCQVSRGKTVLDIASGTGESSCFLAQKLGCHVLGVDASYYMVSRARKKAVQKGLTLEFIQGNAHRLPFRDDTFDAVISECTVCLLDKEPAVREMARVAKPGGYVGMHDICWLEDTPELVKSRLAEIEGERPETLEGWQTLLERAGLTDILTVDKSDLLSQWGQSIRKELGISGQVRVFLKAFKKWGMHGFRDVLESARIFKGRHIGYGIIIGRKA